MHPTATFARAALLAWGLFAFGGAGAQTTNSTDDNVPRAAAAKQAAEISRGDPARWYREDVTAAQRLRTLHKEIGAGLQEAQGACRKLAASERSACMRDARATYQREMADARAQVMAQR